MFCSSRQTLYVKRTKKLVTTNLSSSFPDSSQYGTIIISADPEEKKVSVSL